MKEFVFSVLAGMLVTQAAIANCSGTLPVSPGEGVTTEVRSGDYSTAEFRADLQKTDWTVTRGLEAADREIEALKLRAHGAAERDKVYQARIAELERKVAGMQKQITILYAKKADK